MTKLPDQIAQLTNLLRLDISHNSFSNFPYVVFGLTKIVQVNAEQNQISGMEHMLLFFAKKRIRWHFV